jgi:hypothetical protein
VTDQAAPEQTPRKRPCQAIAHPPAGRSGAVANTERAPERPTPRSGQPTRSIRRIFRQQLRSWCSAAAEVRGRPDPSGQAFQEKPVRAKVPVKLGSLPCPPLIAPLPPSSTAPTWCLLWMAHFNTCRTRKAGLNLASRLIRRLRRHRRNRLWISQPSHAMRGSVALSIGRGRCALPCPAEYLQPTFVPLT